MKRRTALAGITALLITVPHVAVADQSRTAAQTTVTPATVPAITESLEVFQGLAESTSNQAVQGASVSNLGSIDYIGWMMAALGIASSVEGGRQTQEQLEQIEGQITAVQGQIATIDQQIQALSAQIQQLAEQTAYASCSVQTTAMTTALSDIQSAQQTYNTFLNQAAGQAQGKPGQVAPTVKQLTGWAQEVVSSSNQLRIALHDLDNVLLGTSDDGSLPACAQALWNTAGTTAFGWEQAYYSQLYAYVSYWYQVQVQALNLYVEAQHILAVQASGSPGDWQTTNPGAVCTPPLANGDLVTACNEAADAVSMVLGNISDQLIVAGAPYSWGTAGQVFALNPKTGQPYAWLMDINDFQSDGCTLPLSSVNAPCGGTVGTTTSFANPTWGDFSWGAYSGWVPAPAAAWQATGVQTAAVVGTPIWQSLQRVGLGDTASWGPEGGLNGLIIYTGETAASGQGFYFWGSLTGQCFLDTTNLVSSDPTWNVPVCDTLKGGGNLISYVANNPNFRNFYSWPNGQPPNPTRDVTMWYTNPAFFEAWLIGPPTNQGEFEAVNIAPGWLVNTSGMNFTPTPQLRWPALPLANAMCTVKDSAGTTMGITNPGGAYTMCGADMAGWMAAQLPQMPTPAAPLAVAASPKRGAARVSWQPGSVRQKPDGYRIRAKRGKGPWRTVVSDTSAQARAAQLRQKGRRMTYPVPVSKAGFWRFKVVAVIKGHRSRPSEPSRREYVATQKAGSRYYAFTRNGTRRVARVFEDGRVYWSGPRQSGFGIKRGAMITGHTARDPYRWTGRWRQATHGSWKNLQWDGWTRVAGPTRTRKALPRPRTDTPKQP